MSGVRGERDRKIKRRRTHESDSPRSMYDEDIERLEIKPPQAKVHKHGKSRHESPHKHSRSSRHHSKSSHHKRYSKERYERGKSETEEMPPPLMREYTPDRAKRDYAKYPVFKDYHRHQTREDSYREYGREVMGEEDDAINEYRGDTAVEYAEDMGRYEHYRREGYYQDSYYQDDRWKDSRYREPSETRTQPDFPRQPLYHEEGRQKESRRWDSAYVSHSQSDKQKELQQQRTVKEAYSVPMLSDDEAPKIQSKSKESEKYVVKEGESSRHKDRRDVEKSKSFKESEDKKSSSSEQKQIKRETHDKNEPAEKSKHQHKTPTSEESKPVDPKIVSAEVKPESLEKELALREKLIRKRLAKAESTDISTETLEEEKEKYSEGESKVKSQKSRKRKRGEKTPVIVLSDESSNHSTSRKKRSGKTVEIDKPVLKVVSSPIVVSDEENQPTGSLKKDESQTEPISAKTKKHSKIEVKSSPALESVSSEMNSELEHSDASSPVVHRNKKTKKKLRKKKRSSHKGNKKSKEQTKKDKKEKDKEKDEENYKEKEKEKVRDKESEKVKVKDKEKEKVKEKEKEKVKAQEKDKGKVKDKEREKVKGKEKLKHKEKVKDKVKAKEKKRQKDNEWLEKQEKKRLQLIAEAELIEEEGKRKEAEVVAQKNREREKAKKQEREESPDERDKPRVETGRTRGHERERSRDTDWARRHERERDKSEERWNKEFSKDKNLGRGKSNEQKERERSYGTYYHRDRSRERVYGRGEYEVDKSREREASKERWAFHGDPDANYKKERERSTNVSPAREISRDRGYDRSRDKNRSKDRSISRETRRSKERGRSGYKRERSYEEDSRERRRNRSREDRDRERSENRRKDHRKGRERDISKSRKDDKGKHRRDHDKRRSRSRSSSRSRSHRTRYSKYTKPERRYSKEKIEADHKRVITDEKKKFPGSKVVKSAEERKLSSLRRLIRKKQKSLLEKQLNKPKSNTYIPALDGCRSVEEFKCLNRIEEGTYGVVYRAQDKRTNKIVALKRLKMEREKEGFPITSLREINTLLKSQHPNIVTVKEIVVGSNMDKIFIVMDYVEHDLKSLMETMKKKKSGFLIGEIKCLMLQLLRAIAHLHDNWILHRDLKTSNLLFSHQGILKVGDFGLAREYGSPLKVYTPVVVTLWYRSPELLLGTKLYSTPVDMWSIGCIFAELLTMEALFQGKSEIDQLNKIYRMLGTPTEKTWPGFSDLPMAKKVIFGNFPSNQLRIKFMPPLISEAGFNLLSRFLIYDPKKRISAAEALKHDYFTESPRAIEPAMFPTWPAKSEPGFQVASPKPPPGGLYTESADGEGFFIVHGDKRSGFNPGYSLKSTFNLKF